MPRAPRRSPYTWCTWISGLLAGDDSCWWAAWFRSQFTFDKVERGDFDLVAWKVQHTDMVDARVRQLRADGWIVTVEDQNAFTLRGRRGMLSGKPDIVAIRGDEVLVVDCKGGQRKAKDALQVLEYLFALPLASDRVAGKRVSGEVQYRDGCVSIPAEQFTPELKERIVHAMVLVSSDAQPAAVPSVRECSFCDISAADCKARIDTPAAVASVSEW